jgi:hypothetical protein
MEAAGSFLEPAIFFIVRLTISRVLSFVIANVNSR